LSIIVTSAAPFVGCFAIPAIVALGCSAMMLNAYVARRTIWREMVGTTKIEWADFTFNPWQGCTKVSPGCDHCYAERWAARSGLVQWGDAPRRRSSEAYWRQPLKWNDQAARDGVRRRVFCASLADVFDNQVPAYWRRDLFELIRATAWLDWLLLTKRPQNIKPMLDAMADPFWDAWPWPHVWFGTTVENQDEAQRRIPHLLAAPAAVRFLSCEPLIEAVRVDDIAGAKPLDGLLWLPRPRSAGLHAFAHSKIDWVIAGGESGPNARPMHVAWARSLRDQCRDAFVPFFFKQWGEWIDADAWFDVIRRGTDILHVADASIGRIEPWQPAHPLNFTDAALLAQMTGGRRVEHRSDGTTALRVGKKAAGALLDSVLHRAFPVSRV
jgi:protein gp37